MIPTVNRLELVKRAIASALAQTIPVEIIVSDNGSTDGTEEYLSGLDLPPNVRHFRHTPTMPVQKHAAFLDSQVQTEWVVYLSDDDYLEPKFAASVVALIAERPEVALVYTGCHLWYGDVGVPAKVGPKFESAPDFFFEFMNSRRNICLCATAYRIRDRLKIGPQPESILIGDMYYWIGILSAGGTVGCAAGHLSNYYFYRPGARTETNRNPALKWAHESEQFAVTMCAAIQAAPQRGYTADEVRRMGTRFLAVSTGLQFVWRALGGGSRTANIWSFIQLWNVLRGDRSGIYRALSAIVLPRAWLETLVLAQARRSCTVKTGKDSLAPFRKFLLRHPGLLNVAVLIYGLKYSLGGRCRLRLGEGGKYFALRQGLREIRISPQQNAFLNRMAGEFGYWFDCAVAKPVGDLMVADFSQFDLDVILTMNDRLWKSLQFRFEGDGEYLVLRKGDRAIRLHAGESGHLTDVAHDFDYHFNHIAGGLGGVTLVTDPSRMSRDAG